ncbi:MAG: efflux RND transporter periplasmic adaptor subunit [Phocaeicola sp.]
MKKQMIYVAVAIALSGAVGTYLAVQTNGKAESQFEANETTIKMAMSTSSTGQSMTSPASQPMTQMAPTMAGQMAPAMQGSNMNMSSAPNTLTLPGEIVADKRSEIYAKVLSYVKSIRVDIGSKVEKGDLLMELEAPELTAQLASLHSKTLSLEAQVKLSNSNYERVLKASKIEGSISQLALDEALSKMESNQALLVATQADYEQVKSMTDYLTVRAPFAGVITRRAVDVGSMVGPASNGQREPLLVIQDNQKLRLQIALNEKYTPLIAVGDTLSFTVRSLGGQPFKAQVSRKAGALDSRLRAEMIEADFVNESGRLLPGMVGDVVVKME